MILEAQLIDLHLRQIYPVALEVEEQKIKKITKINPKPRLPYLLPGFIDAHVHVESSMLVPSEFARLAVVHGTVATISDPHEIANVCGMQGVEKRAQRRQLELLAKGENVPLEEIKLNLESRDQIDSSRSESPLLKVSDAVEIDTSSLTFSEQVEQIIELVKKITLN